DFLMLVEEADAGVAIVAGVGPGDFADATVSNGSVGFPIGIVGGAVRADLENLFVTFDSVADADGLLHGVGHRLFAIDVLAGFHGMNGNFAMPMVGRGDEHSVHIFAIEQAPIIHVPLAFADVFCASDASLIHVAHRDHLDIFGLGFFNESTDMTSAHAADADHADPDSIIGPGC